MWYRIDYLKLSYLLLPALLRSRFLVSLLGVLTVALRSIGESFYELKIRTDLRLSVDGTVQSLERVLNEEFSLEENQIHIESREETDYVFWYMEREGPQGCCMYMENEAVGIVMSCDGEGTYDGENFILYVPSFLCGPNGEDTYGHLRTIKNILNNYKPAGRSYRIKIYDYE